MLAEYASLGFSGSIIAQTTHTEGEDTLAHARN